MPSHVKKTVGKLSSADPNKHQPYNIACTIAAGEVIYDGTLGNGRHRGVRML
jgi:hypothetical protein